MKGLITLIKLSKRTLDELRRNLVVLENQKEELERLALALKEELAREMELAAHAPEIGHFFGDFAKRIQTRQEKIGADKEALDKKIEAMRIDISNAFSEMKKYEIALENAKLRLQEKRNRQETEQLDEVAAQQHQRKNEIT